jgi:hypothetical protein
VAVTSPLAPFILSAGSHSSTWYKTCRALARGIQSAAPPERPKAPPKRLQLLRRTQPEYDRHRDEAQTKVEHDYGGNVSSRNTPQSDSRRSSAVGASLNRPCPSDCCCVVAGSFAGLRRPRHEASPNGILRPRPPATESHRSRASGVTEAASALRRSHPPRASVHSRQPHGLITEDFSAPSCMRRMEPAHGGPSARTCVHTGVGGNAGRGFDFASLDLRLSRRLSFGEHTNLEVIAEGFNVLNRVNLQLPSEPATAEQHARPGEPGEAADVRPADRGRRPAPDSVRPALQLLRGDV